MNVTFLLVSVHFFQIACCILYDTQVVAIRADDGCSAIPIFRIGMGAAATIASERPVPLPASILGYVRTLEVLSKSSLNLARERICLLGTAGCGGVCGKGLG